MKLSAHELAKALALPQDTLERWVRQGRIPVRKSGSTFSFSYAALKSWTAKHNVNFDLSSPQEGQSASQQGVSLVEALEAGGVVYDLEGVDPSDILENASHNVPGLDEAERAELFVRLEERERMASTGVGRGVALPHPRTPLEACQTPAIVTCFLKYPVEFGAVDDEPVRILFLILSPDVRTHLQLLSKISYCVREPSFLSFLGKVPQVPELIEKVAKFEARL